MHGEPAVPPPNSPGLHSSRMRRDRRTTRKTSCDSGLYTERHSAREPFGGSTTLLAALQSWLTNVARTYASAARTASVGGRAAVGAETAAVTDTSARPQVRISRCIGSCACSLNPPPFADGTPRGGLFA